MLFGSTLIAGQSKVYGASEPTLTFTNDAGLSAGSFTGAMERAAGEIVASYAINLVPFSAGTNYSLSLPATPVNFTITPKPVVITPTAGKIGRASGRERVQISAVDASLKTKRFKGALGPAAGENVGSYAIDVGTPSAGTQQH